MEKEQPIYFDHAATSPILPVALETLVEVHRNYIGNSSSSHIEGKRSREILQDSVQSFCEIFNVDERQVVFTSGGTESNNLAVWGALGGIAPASRWLNSNLIKREQVLTTTGEHPSVQKIFEELDLLGVQVSWAPIDINGFVRPDAIKNSLDANKSIRLCSIHHVQNELGTIQPLKEIINIIRTHSPNSIVHVDAVQSFTKTELSIKELDADLISISAHKIGGPKGVGALILSENIQKKELSFGPLLLGSKQQNGLRPGTIPVPLIASFSAAADHQIRNLKENRHHVLKLRERLDEILLSLRVQQHSPLNYRDPSCIPNIINFSIPGTTSSEVLESLSEKGICVSAGAACQSGNASGSPLLLRMGLGKEKALSAIRMSLSPFNTLEELEIFRRALGKIMRT